MHFGATKLTYSFKEMFVEAATNTFASCARMHTDKMNICLRWCCLRTEARQKALDLSILLNHKACWLEMLE